MTGPDDMWGNAVRRWHQNRWPALRNSGDCTHAHSARVAMLILHLWPDASRDLLVAALCHDDHEGGPGGTGDVCGPSKQGDYGLAYDVAAGMIEDARGTWVELTADDQARLKFADRLDAYRWVQLVEPRALVADGWPEARDWLIGGGVYFGFRTRIEEMLGPSHE